MKKEKLLRFISKYHLGGNVESVAWKVDGDKVSTQLVSDDKTMIGKVQFNGLEFNENDAEFGVSPTSKAIGIIGVMGDEFTPSLSKVEVAGETKYAAFHLKHENLSLRLKLAELVIIPKVPAFKEYPDNFQIKLDWNSELVDIFLKSKAAIGSDRKTFAFVKKDGKVNLVFGYSEINSDTIEWKLDIDTPDDLDIIAFSADDVKEILNANKDATSGYIEVSLDGLAHVHFEGDDFKADYFLSEQDAED